MIVALDAECRLEVLTKKQVGQQEVAIIVGGHDQIKAVTCKFLLLLAGNPSIIYLKGGRCE